MVKAPKKVLKCFNVWQHFFIQDSIEYSSKSYAITWDIFCMLLQCHYYCIFIFYARLATQYKILQEGSIKAEIDNKWMPKKLSNITKSSNFTIVGCWTKSDLITRFFGIRLLGDCKLKPKTWFLITQFFGISLLGDCKLKPKTWFHKMVKYILKVFQQQLTKCFSSFTFLWDHRKRLITFCQILRQSPL